MKPEEAGPRFATTRWSVVLAAGRPDDETSRPALEELCSAWWFPLFAFARRRGLPREDARDRVQGFFAHLLAKSALAVADPERGRFRSFLLTSFRNFLENERARGNALARGGGRVRVPLAGPDEAGVEPTHRETPEQRFDRDWAVTLLRRVLDAVEAEYESRGRTELFRALAPAIAGGSATEVAAVAGLTPGAARVALHRLRRRYREELRREIRDTVEKPDDVEDEIRALFRALAAPAGEAGGDAL